MEPPHVDMTVFAHPGSRRDSIEIDRDAKALIIHVTAPPEKGKANKAIIKLVARFFHVASSNIAVIHGSTSSTKKLRVIGMDEAQLARVLDPID